MRLDLRATLRTAWSRRSPATDRPLVVLEWQVTGQPELSRILEYYAVDAVEGIEQLRHTARAAGFTLPVVRGDDPYEYALGFLLNRDAWREVTLEVEVVSFQGRGRLQVRQVRRTCD